MDVKNTSPQDNILYNEDNILVRTVCITELKPTITKEILEEFFDNKFGCIESVHLHYNILRNKPNFALITFTCAKVAAKAIRSRVLYINSYFCEVQAADSWNQPATIKEPINNDGLEFSLLRLNDDCILHLYKFLNLNDIANLAKTCDRLRELSEPIIKKKCENFKLGSYDSCASKTYTLMDIRTIMTNFGHYIQSLTLNGRKFKSSHNHVRYLEIVCRRCANLQELHLNNLHLSGFLPYVDNYLVDKPEHSLNNLRMLNLDNCKDDGFYLMEKFGRSSNLIELKLYCCTLDIYGNFLELLKKLETINIQGCRDCNISLYILVNLLTSNATTLTSITLILYLNTFTSYATLKELLNGSLKNLKYLNTDIPLCDDKTKLMSGELNNIQTLCISYPNISNESVAVILHELSVNNKQIVELDISNKTLNDSMKNDLLQLETLQILKVNAVQQLNSTFLINCAQKMKELSVLCCQKADISAANVVKIVELAEKLIELDVVKCKNVTWNIIENVGDVLKKYNDRPKLKLNIRISQNVNYEMKKLNEKYKTYLEVDTHIRPSYYEGNDDDDDSSSVPSSSDDDDNDGDDYNDDDDNDDDDNDDDDNNDDMDDDDNNGYIFINNVDGPFIERMNVD